MFGAVNIVVPITGYGDTTQTTPHLIDASWSASTVPFIKSQIISSLRTKPRPDYCQSMSARQILPKCGQRQQSARFGIGSSGRTIFILQEGGRRLSLICRKLCALGHAGSWALPGSSQSEDLRFSKGFRYLSLLFASSVLEWNRFANGLRSPGTF